MLFRGDSRARIVRTFDSNLYRLERKLILRRRWRNRVARLLFILRGMAHVLLYPLTFLVEEILRVEGAARGTLITLLVDVEFLLRRG